MASDDKFMERLALLTPRERDVINLRAGQIDGVKYTHEQIAERYGVSVARVRQLENEALSKMAGKPTQPPKPRKPSTSENTLRRIK